MKLKHFAAIFVFLTSFMLSILLVGITASRKCTAPNITPAQTQTIRQTNTELQARIRIFLEADRQTGFELSDDLTDFRSNADTFTVEKKATSNLLKKMQNVECQNLPADFCAAWDEHHKAWIKKHDFLQQADRDKNHGKEYLTFEREINKTYFKMLGVAKKYGVYFSY